MLTPKRAARAFRPHLVQHPEPDARHELHEVAKEHDGLRGEDHLVKPERRARRDPFRRRRRVQSPLLLANLGARVGSAASAAAAASAAVSHVDLASVAPKMTRVWPPKPVAMGPGA